MSHCGIEPQSDPCQGSILTIILVGLSITINKLLFIRLLQKERKIFLFNF